MTASACKDLKLWISFIEKANRGIDLNLLVDRMPDWMIRTDACEHGLGGYSLTTGRAWQWEIPEELRHLKSINFLEFLACVAGILLSIIEDQPRPGVCYLSLGDNTASLGWLSRSNFDESDVKEQAAHSGLARYFALAMADASLCQGSQWFAGKENTVADLLSREHTKSEDYLTRYIPFVYPTQVSKKFKVSPLPERITSLLTYWVRHKRDTTELPPELTRAQTRTGGTGKRSSKNVRFAETTTWTNSTGATGSRCSGHLHNQSDAKNTPRVQKEMLTWLQTHAKQPSAMFVRPSSLRVDPIRPWTRTENLLSFYSDSSRDIKTTIPGQDNKNRFPSSSSCK